MKTTTSCPWKGPGRASAAKESLIDSYVPTIRSIDLLDPLFTDAFVQGQEVVILILIVYSLLRLRGYRYGRERIVQ